MRKQIRLERDADRQRLRVRKQIRLERDTVRPRVRVREQIRLARDAVRGRLRVRDKKCGNLFFLYGCVVISVCPYSPYVHVVLRETILKRVR